MAAMNLKVGGEKTAVARIGKSEVVLLPLGKYQALLRRLADLEDVMDANRGMAEFRAGHGRPFADYLKGRKGKRRVSNPKR